MEPLALANRRLQPLVSFREVSEGAGAAARPRDPGRESGGAAADAAEAAPEPDAAWSGARRPDPRLMLHTRHNAGRLRTRSRAPACRLRQRHREEYDSSCVAPVLRR